MASAKSAERACEVLAEFVDEYVCNEPYDEYIVGCGISSLELMLKEEKYHPRVKTVTLKDEESPEDLCIYVRLEKVPPAEFPLPIKFKNVRVFYDLA